MSGDPGELRWADPDGADSAGQRELIIAVLNLTDEVRRIADHLTVTNGDSAFDPDLGIPHREGQ